MSLKPAVSVFLTVTETNWNGHQL